MFQSERWGEQDWSLPIEDGTYEVELYFAEIYSGTFSEGARVFDVSIEGDLVLDEYDVFADVGAESGVVKRFITSVNDGVLNVSLDAVTENPSLKGLVIHAAEGTPDATATPEPTEAPTTTPTPEPTATPTAGNPQRLPNPGDEPDDGPQWATSASVASSALETGERQTVSVRVESETADRGLVDVEIYDAEGNKIFQRYWDDRRFDAGKPRNFVIRGRIPADAEPGEYTVKVGIFEPQPAWGTFLAWEDEAATFQVQ
ncbi:MAG: malectin domain-containing carbohydrate-binding protein [Dehalococcoidia bacterium]|nr:malectin domain-containing carbohydrate-binding protein [Dehalococcoidia bacterium]